MRLYYISCKRTGTFDITWGWVQS